MWDVTCSKPEASLQFCTRLKAQFHKLSHLCKAQYKKANMSVLYHWFEKWFWRLRAQYCWIYAVAWAITFCCTLCESKSQMACYGHCLAESEFYLKKKPSSNYVSVGLQCSSHFTAWRLEPLQQPVLLHTSIYLLPLCSLPKGHYTSTCWVLDYSESCSDSCSTWIHFHSPSARLSQPKPGVWMSPW